MRKRICVIAAAISAISMLLLFVVKVKRGQKYI